MKRTRIFYASALLFCAGIQAQNLYNNNLNQNLVALNPSFAGSNGGIRNQLSYKNLWPRHTGEFVSYANAFDMLLKKAKGGIAVSWFHENYHKKERTESGYAAAYAQYFKLKNSGLTLVPSVQFAYFRNWVDVSRLPQDLVGLVFNEPSPSSGRNGVFSLSSGFVGHYRRHLSFGAYFFHLNRPARRTFVYSKIRMRSVVHGAYTFYFSDRHSLQIMGVWDFVKPQQSARFSVNSVLFRHIIVGTSYYHDWAIQLDVGYHARYFNIVLASDLYNSWGLHASFNLREKEKRSQLMRFENM